MKDTIDLSAARTAKQTKQQSAAPTTHENAPAWTGELDVHILKGDVKGEPLFAALQNRARQLGHTLGDMCACLSFSYPYYSQLRSGRRTLSGASEEFTAASAKYLGIPRLTVLALADLVRPEDLYESQNAIETHLPRAFEYVCEDPHWAHLAIGDVRTAGPRTQYLIVRLYEQMAGLQFLPPAIVPEQLAQGMAALQDIRAGLQPSKAAT